MSVKFVKGDIFNSNVQTLVNPINVSGQMGASLALLFRTKFPGLYKDYLQKHKEGALKVGFPYLWKPENPTNQWILNFPTKDEWKNSSKLEYISLGLNFFMANYENWGITSIAFPALGCGKFTGKLPWHKVSSLMESMLTPIKIDCLIYAPVESSSLFVLS